MAVDKRSFYTQQFSKFTSVEFAVLLADLLLEHPIKFKITSGRKTKLGDFRYPSVAGGGEVQISVNGDMNEYNFVITTVHEFAHFITYKKYGRSVKGHGPEWQQEYRNLLYKYIESGHFPKDIEIALVNSLVNVKASSCTDIQLSKALGKYDEKKSDLIPLDDLPKNATFVLQGRVFVKGSKRRTRIECTEKNSKKAYLVHALADVKWIKEI